MQSITKITLKYAFLLILLFSAGCSTTPTKQNPAKFAATHGYVLAAMPNRESRGALVLQSTSSKAKFALSELDSTPFSTRGLWVPEGTYRLLSWNDHKLDGYPAISVDANEIIDLGGFTHFTTGDDTFVLLPFTHPDVETSNLELANREILDHLPAVNYRKWDVTKVPNPTKQLHPSTNLGLIADLISAYGRHVNKTPLNEQLVSTTNPARFYELAISGLPPIPTDPSVDEHGNLYFGAGLGQIRKRLPKGDWSSIDTGTVFPVTSVANLKGSLYAGLANGSIVASHDLGTTWEPHIEIRQGEAIVGIFHLSGKWVVVSAKSESESVYTSQISEVNILTETAENFTNPALAASVKVAKGAFAHRLKVGILEGDLAFNLPSKIYRFSADDNNLHEIPIDIAISRMNIGAQNNTLAAMKLQGMFSKLRVSRDGGETWTEKSPPPLTAENVYFDEKQGLAARWNAGAFAVAMELMSYDAAKDSWEKVSEAPAPCARVLADHEGKPNFCVSPGGTIFGATRSGWEMEFVNR